MMLMTMLGIRQVAWLSLIIIDGRDWRVRWDDGDGKLFVMDI